MGGRKCMEKEGGMREGNGRERREEDGGRKRRWRHAREAWLKRN